MTWPVVMPKRRMIYLLSFDKFSKKCDGGENKLAYDNKGR